MRPVAALMVSARNLLLAMLEHPFLLKISELSQRRLRLEGSLEARAEGRK